MLNNSGFSQKLTPPRFSLQSVMAISFSTLMDGSCIVSRHDVTNNKMGSGNPIDPIDAVHLIDKLVERKEVKSGWLDHRVMYETDNVLVWYRKADTKPTSLWFRTGEKAPIEVLAKLPTLIFKRLKQSSTTFVYACAGANRPKQNQKMYQAPLFNTSLNGAFCLGSATVPVGDIETEVMIDGTEKAIFDSLFTHSNQPNTFSKIKYGQIINNQQHIKIWKAFAKSNRRPMCADLEPMKCSLLDLTDVEKRA